MAVAQRQRLKKGILKRAWCIQKNKEKVAYTKKNTFAVKLHNGDGVVMVMGEDN